MSPPAPSLGVHYSPTADLPFSYPGATMIIVLLSVLLVSYSLALLLRHVAAPPPAPTTTPFAPLTQPLPGASRTRGLEDDPTRWPPSPVRGDWTALDDRQLIRLLTDSASTTPPAADSP